MVSNYNDLLKTPGIEASYIEIHNGSVLYRRYVPIEEKDKEKIFKLIKTAQKTFPHFLMSYLEYEKNQYIEIAKKDITKKEIKKINLLADLIGRELK